MPRTARIVIPDVACHVTQRGNNREDVFFAEDDRRVYLKFLLDYSQQFRLDVDAYCLMTNHLHLVVTPHAEGALAATIGRTNQRYAQYVNHVRGRTGHLFQSRFFSCLLDDKHLVAAIRYVEQNPVRGGIVHRAWEYAWSSAAAHVGQQDRSGLLDLKAWRAVWPETTWRQMLTEGLDDGPIDTLRLCTSRGRPLGGESFLGRVERQIGRRVRALPRGRPKGWRKTYK